MSAMNDFRRLAVAGTSVALLTAASCLPAYQASAYSIRPSVSPGPRGTLIRGNSLARLPPTRAVNSSLEGPALPLIEVEAPSRIGMMSVEVGRAVETAGKGGESAHAAGARIDEIVGSGGAAAASEAPLAPAGAPFASLTPGRGVAAGMLSAADSHQTGPSGETMPPSVPGPSRPDDGSGRRPDAGEVLTAARVPAALGALLGLGAGAMLGFQGGSIGMLLGATLGVSGAAAGILLGGYLGVRMGLRFGREKGLLGVVLIVVSTGLGAWTLGTLGHWGALALGAKTGGAGGALGALAGALGLASVGAILGGMVGAVVFAKRSKVPESAARFLR